MNARRVVTASRLGLLGAAFFALAGCGSTAEEREQAGSIHENWQIVGGDSHGNQAKDALYFLKADVRSALFWAETRPDMPRLLEASAHDGEQSVWNGKQVGTQEYSSFHFDNCRFKEATLLLRDHYDRIVAALGKDAGPYSPDAPAWSLALKQFGFVLHAAQDFYAHSNWVESGETDIVDSGEKQWTVLLPNAVVGKHMQVLEYDFEPSTTAKLDRDNHLLSLTGGKAAFGLISGRFKNKDNDGHSGCPDEDAQPPVSMKHGAKFSCEHDDLVNACVVEGICAPDQPGQDSCDQIWRRTYMAKDHDPEVIPAFSSRADVDARKAWRDRAHGLALKQTTHEFCRLANLLEESDPAQPAPNFNEGGRARLYRAWVDDPIAADAACLTPSHYVDRTLGANLGGVRGSRISAIDFNGDDYPDLVVRDATDKESDLATPGARHVWLLANDRKGGFTDVTASSGFLAGRVPGGTAKNQRATQVVAFADLDNNGTLDVFSGSPPYTPQGLSGVERPELLRNDGHGNFSRYASYPLPKTVYPGAATFFDSNRDGLIDLFVAARDPSSAGATARGAGWLFKGTGTATSPFSDATSLIASNAGYFQASLACDLNGDGLPELMAPTMDRGPGRLWQAKSDGTYVERGGPSKFAFDDTAAFGDNMSYLAHCAYVNQRQQVWSSFSSTAASCNARPGGCPAACTKFPCDAFRPATDAEKAACAGAAPYPASRAAMQTLDAASWVQARDGATNRSGGHAFSAVCVDVDGDGRLDIVQTTQRKSTEGASADSVQILHNVSADKGDVQFERLSPETIGVAPHHEAGSDWVESEDSASALDVDNDGLVDVFLDGATAQGTRGRLLRNTSKFVNNHWTLSFAALGMQGLDRAAGVAAADFDRDGDLDLVVGQSCFHLGAGEDCDAEQIHLFDNQLPASPSAHWLELKLVGRGGAGQSNKAAIGARASIAITQRTLVQEVGGGQGTFGSQSDLLLHFGLGTVSPTVDVLVTWPANRVTVSEHLTLVVNKAYQIEEGVAGAPAKATELTLAPP